MAVANEFQGKPIAFIAVNSGNDRAEVNRYVRRNEVSWPVIVDLQREFEKASGVGMVSLKSIWKFAAIDASGTMRKIGSSDIEKSATKLLQDAKWNVDPTELDPSLQELWMGVEFGNYAAVAKRLNKASKNRQPDIKSGAEVLLAWVNEQLSSQLGAAEEDREAGDLWSAYKQYLMVRGQFDGYEMSVDLRAVLKELKADEKVANELAAQKRFDRAESRFAKIGMDRTVVMLKSLVEKYPGTEAATAAQKIIDSQ